MFRLYDKAFKIGFALTILAFIAINIAKYMTATREHAENQARFVNVAPARWFPRWGFPFDWDGYYFGFPEDGLVLNFVIIVTAGFIVGILFRHLNLRFGRRNH